MAWLTSLPGAALLVGSLLLWVAIALVVNAVLHRMGVGATGERAGAVAAAYMTALGSLFAILTGFLINSEYATLREAQSLISREAAAAGQLAFSTEGLPAADTERIQDALVDYLDALDRDEWRALGSGTPEESAAFASFKALKGAVFDIGTAEFAPSASVQGMQDAVNQLTQLRRERAAVAATEVPVALIALSALAGLALVVNALVVTLRAGPRYTVVAWGIVVVVALDLAAIVGIAAPFRGPFQASREPLVALAEELRAGRFLPWLDATADPSADGSRRCLTAAGDAAGATDAPPPACVEFGIGEPITVGVLAWLSGESTAGEDALVGSQLAVDYLDGRLDGRPGELLGHDVELAVVDDGCGPTVGEAAAAQLAREPHLLGVVGTTCSSAALGAADRVLSDAGVLLVSPANTLPALTEPERHQRFYFRTIFNDLIQGSVVADHATRVLDAGTAATVSDRNPYAEALAEVFSRQFRRGGGAPTTALTVVPGDGRPAAAGDLTADEVAAQLAAAPPAVVFVPMFDPRCTEVVGAVRRRPELAATTVVVGEACQSTEILDRLGPLADGVLASGPDAAELQQGPFYQERLLPALVRDTGAPPSGVYHAYAFDATNLLFGALRRAAVRLPGGALRVDRDALRAAMLQVDGYPGISGQLSCRSSGECAQSARIALYAAPNWPVNTADGPARAVFSQAETLVEVQGTS